MPLRIMLKDERYISNIFEEGRREERIKQSCCWDLDSLVIYIVTYNRYSTYPLLNDVY